MTGDVAGTDPNYVSMLEEFAGLSHEEIYAKTRAIDPGALQALSATWHEVSVAFERQRASTMLGVLAEIGNGWQGRAAAAAADGVEAFFRSAQRTTEVLTAVSMRLGEAAHAGEAVKIAVAPPVAGDPVALLPGAVLNPSAAGDTTALQEEKEAARRDAVRAMSTIYAKSFAPAGDNVPAFGASAAPGGAVVRMTVSSNSRPGTGAATGTATSGSGGHRVGTAAGPDQPGTPNPAAGRPATAVPASTELPLTDQPGADPAGTGPAAASPATMPAAALGAGQTAAPASTFATTWPGGDADRASYNTTGGPGQPGVNTGTLATPGAKRKDEDREREGVAGLTGLGVGALGGGMAGAIAAGSDTVRPVAGTAAAGKGAPIGMVPAGRKADGEDDTEHLTPTYLVTMDNASELIGELDPASPAVLGEWDEDRE